MEYLPLFNVRVYGLLVHEDRILLSDEIHGNMMITKFPGGGLQFGEGTIECLVREFKEEIDLDIQIKEHFYTTDFFQPSAFDPSQQVIGIYYLVSAVSAGDIDVTELKFDFDPVRKITQRFRWVMRSAITPEDLTLPIDKKVVELLAQNYGVKY